MHLLDVNTRRLKKYVEEKNGKICEKYGILSHRWFARDDEILFQDIESADHTLLRKREGFFKLVKCCEQAKRDDLGYVWIDSCCINRSDSTELQESINSMYRWYENADRCYVYLKNTSNPVSGSLILGKEEDWFRRGWTLQELIAPKQVVFYDRRWQSLGDKTSLKGIIFGITGISTSLLDGTQKPQDCSIAERMSWACDRETTKGEDRAYSLLGLFDVNMPMLYGEGELKAFLRLQEEIIKISDDHSIFAWRGVHKAHGLLATSPEAFRGCNRVRNIPSREGRNASTMTNRGLSITLRLIPWLLDTYLASIDCVEIVDNYGQPLQIFLRRLTADDQYARVSVRGQDVRRGHFLTETKGNHIYVRQPGTEVEQVGADYKRVTGFRLSNELLKSSSWKGKDQNAQEQFIIFESGALFWRNLQELKLSGYREFESAHVGFDFDFNPILILSESADKFKKYLSICPLTKDEAVRNNGVWQGMTGKQIEWNRIGHFVRRMANGNLVEYNQHQDFWAIKGDRLNGLDAYIEGTNIRIILDKTLTERQELVWDLKIEHSHFCSPRAVDSQLPK
ncbi:HET-domain-containing protein [Hypoxylon sp. EC38]|nr:HET-domain-containing protein [Hypoxylon sp. EC38]